MEMTEAARVTDVYSALAASFAIDTQELAEAMSRTASGIASVGVSFESASAMITTITAATRESASVIGSSLKSLAARYGSMTTDPSKLVDADGQEASLNKIDKALKSIGISIQDVNGQFRDMDDVVLELGEKWNTLNRNEQRFVATAFAGNLQSNRFLALVSNIDEYKKALEVANDSEGTGTLQFNKTLDNIETRLTKLKTAWQLFYTDSGIEKAIKWAITGLTNIINRMNKLPKLFKVIPLNALTAISTIITGVKLLAQVISNKIEAAITRVVTKARQSIREVGQEAREDVDKTSAKIAGANTQRGGSVSNTSTGSIWGSKGNKWSSIIQIAGSVLGMVGASGAFGNNEVFNSIVGGVGRTASLGATGFKLGTMVGHPILGTAIGTGLGTLETIFDVISSISGRAEQKLEELKQKADEAENKKLEGKQTVSNLEDYIEQYQELSKAQYDSNEAKQQFLDLNAEIAEKYPDLLVKYDTEGNKIIQLTELQKKLNEEKANYRKANFDSIKTNYDKVETERDNAKKDYNNTVLTTSLNHLIDVSAHGKEDYFVNMWKPYLTEMGEEEEAYFLGLFDNLATVTDTKDRAVKAAEYFNTDFGVQVLQHFIDNLAKEIPDSLYVSGIQDWINDRDKYITAEKELKSEQLKGAFSYMSSTFHFGDDTFEAYSPIYQSAKSAGFDLDQYIGNIMGGYDEKTYKALIANEKEWAKRAQELANQFKEEILNDNDKASFVGDIQNKSKAEIDKFKEENEIIYKDLLQQSWQEIESNLESGLNYINEKLMENGLVVEGKENAYDNLSSYITDSNLSLWRGIVENDAEHFEDYYDLVAELAENNQFSIADITNTALKADLSTLSGIQELENTLKTNGMYSANKEEIEKFLKEARSKVRVNPTLEFAAMLDSYTSAYEELDKLASSLSTGLELKDAISWAAKMGTSIDQFVQKEGKFFVSQEQFWKYALERMLSPDEISKQLSDYYDNFTLDEYGAFIPKEGANVTQEEADAAFSQFDEWARNNAEKFNSMTRQEAVAAFIDDMRKTGTEATAAYKNLLESYAIQSIQAFGLITTDIRDKLFEQGLDDAQIKELEDKYLGSATTSTLFSTGKIDVADIGKLPEVLQGIVDTETGKIKNYKDALTSLYNRIKEGDLDAATYAPIYAEAVNSARSDLEAALEGTLDGARASTEYVKDLIAEGVITLNEKTGKYQIDLSSQEKFNKAIKELQDKGYSLREANQALASSALSQGQDIDYITDDEDGFKQEYNYQLSQARKDVVEGLQDAVFDATKSIDISKLYQANKDKLDDLASQGIIRIEEEGEKVAIQILGGTIENILDLIKTLGGEETEIDSSAIISTINSYFDQGLTGDLSKSAAEMLIKRLGLAGDFSVYFEATSSGYKFKNNEVAKSIASRSAKLMGGLPRTVSQFETDFNNLIKAGYTVEGAIKQLGHATRTAAEIMKNGPQNEYERVIYDTYQGAMNDIYSAMMDGLSNPVGAQIDLTKAKQIGGNAYDTLKEIMTVVETETGEAFGYFKDNTTTEVINMMRSLAIGGNSTVADLLAEYYNTIARMITDGMNGDLSATNIEWLQKAFKLTDRMFVKAGTSFRLTEEGARRIYTTMNGIDAIAGNLSLSVFAKSLQEADYKLQSVSAVSKEIIRLQEEIANAHGDTRKALENELALYQEILKVNQQNASSFNMMNNPIMGGAENAIEAYKGLAQARQAIADMKTTNEYGMNAMDPTNAIRLAEISEQNLLDVLGEGKNMADVYAAFGKSMRDIGGNVVIDMSNVATELGVSFDALGAAFGDGSNTALKEIAESQVKMLDAQINMLEGIVAMEDLTIDRDETGKIDLDNWIVYDKDGNQIADKAKQLGGMLTEVSKGIDGIDEKIIAINNATGENITFKTIMDNLNSGTEAFEAYLNSLPPEVQEQVEAFINNIKTELEKMNLTDFDTIDFGNEDTHVVDTLINAFRKILGIKDDNTIDITKGKPITPTVSVSSPSVSSTSPNEIVKSAKSITLSPEFSLYEGGDGKKQITKKLPTLPNKGNNSTLTQDNTVSVVENVKFDGITYTIEGFEETFSTKEEALAAIAEKYGIETQTLEAKTAEITIPENATLNISFTAISTNYLDGEGKAIATDKEAAKDFLSKEYGLDDTILPEKTATISQNIIVDFVATLQDKDGNPMPDVMETGLDIKVVPQLDDFATKISEAILEKAYEVVLAPVIRDRTAFQDAIQEAINARAEYMVTLTPQFSNPNFSNGQTIQSFRGGSGSGSSSSSKKSSGSSSSGADVASTSIANILKSSGLGATINGLSQNLNDTRTSAIAFGTSLKGIIPSSVANSASSARYSLSNLSSSVTQVSNDLTKIFNKIIELVKQLQDAVGGTKAKGNVALAKGSNDALATGTLMGELGPELWVSGGHYYIAGQGGAEFVNLPDDAIVFNHLQTRSLLANGNTTRGRAIKGEDRAVAFAKGSPEGPAHASASDTLQRLKDLRSLWQGLLDASASDLSKKAGGGGGGGGAEDYKTFTADLERWYNLLRQIANYEQKITYEQKQRENFKHGQEYVDSLEKELKYLEKQADAYATLSELQKSYYDQRRKDLNNTQYGKLIFTYTEDGLMQYLDDVVDANGNKQSRGLAILAELNRQSSERGQSYWDREGKNLYTGSFKVNDKQTIKGTSGGAAAQLMYLKSVGFDLSELLYDSEGSSNIGKNAAETATNMMQTFFDNVDGWMEELDSLYDSYNEYLEKIEDNTAAQQKILQEYIDNQISVEDKLLKAITDRQQKMIDTLKDQIDIIQEAGQEYTQGLSEALSKERNLYNENKDDAELASKMRRLGILQRTGASASEIKALQDEIDNQLQENYFDAQQKQIDAIQEAIDTQLETLNQQLDVMEEALNYQKENGLLWAEVYEMMAEWTPEAMLDFIETYTSSYRENSQQKNSEDSKETLKQLEIWAASRGFDFSREPHKGNSKDYTKPDTSNDVDAPDTPRPSGGTTTGGGTSGSGSSTSTTPNGFASPQAITVGYTKLVGDTTGTPSVREVKGGTVPMYGAGGWITKDGKHVKIAWAQKAGALPAGKYYDYGQDIYRDPDAKHRRVVYSATTGQPYYVIIDDYKKGSMAVSSYSSGGMNYSTGMAMLHGTSSKPEAILNASDTKLFREQLFGNGDFSLRQAIATIDLLRDQIASTTNNNSSVDFNGVTINISSDVIANDYDAQRAGRNIFDEMIKMSRKSTMLGVSRR